MANDLMNDNKIPALLLPIRLVIAGGLYEHG